MKNNWNLIVLVLALASTMVGNAQCNQNNKCVQNLAKYTLLKSYNIDLPERKGQMDHPDEASFPAILSKGVRYRLAGCPNKMESKTDMVYALYLGTDLISTNRSKSGKIYAALEFVCNKTGVYYLKAYFVEGAKGCGSASLSMAK